MKSSASITNSTAIDFVLTHILSIDFFSGAGIAMAKRYESSFIKNISAQPIVALHPKTYIYRNIKKNWITNRKPTPCLESTGYSIQVLAKLVQLYHDGQWKFLLPIPESFISEMLHLAIMQLDFSIEHLNRGISSIYLLTVLLESCIKIIQTLHGKLNIRLEINKDYTEVANMIYQRICTLHNLEAIDTLELSRIVRAVSIYHQILPFNADDLLAETALELINRQNRLGFFQQGRIESGICPLSSQFHIIDSLLHSYPHIGFDVILEEAFAVFNRLYELAWNDAVKCFTFRQNHKIRYNAFSLGCILRGLDSLIHWINGDEHKNRLISIRDDCYLYPIINTYFKAYNEEINFLWNHLTKSSNSISTTTTAVYPLLRKLYVPVFPDTILVEPSSEIQWYLGRIMRHEQSLYLCSCILDVIELQPVAGDEYPLEDLLNFFSNFLS